jgi:hypothetical protein
VNAQALGSGKRPNTVFMLTDNLGYEGTGRLRWRDSPWSAHAPPFRPSRGGSNQTVRVHIPISAFEHFQSAVHNTR